MKTNYYSIKDDVAGEYGPMFPAKNDGVALRHAKNLLKDVPDKEEYSLWCLCQMDTESGQFSLPFEMYEIPIESKEVNE